MIVVLSCALLHAYLIGMVVGNMLHTKSSGAMEVNVIAIIINVAFLISCVIKLTG